MISINPKEIPTGKLHGYLLGAVAPRPIAFASTIDEKGTPNLSPFSFFNVFGSNPPTMIFHLQEELEVIQPNIRYKMLKKSKR